jgi:hypothetical protein
LESKPCTLCKKKLSLDEFALDNRRISGVGSRCRECERKRKHEYRKNNKEKKTKITKEYRSIGRGIVYCVECKGYYKFGKTTTSMKKRLSSMRTGNPFEVKIVWVKRTNDMNRYERILHDQIKDNNVRGEWYDIPRVLALELRKQVKHDS